MKDDTPMPRDFDGDAAERAELARQIDALMREPPKARPSIIVVGDDAISGITPMRRAG